MSETESIHQKDSQELTSETNQSKFNGNKLKKPVENDSTTILKPIVCKGDDLREFIGRFIDGPKGRSIDKIPFISLVDVSNITDFSCMFQYSIRTSKLIKLSNWDVSNGTNFSYMFQCCYSLKDLSGLSHWNVSKGTNFDQMFENTQINDIKPLANWTVPKGYDVRRMFVYSCQELPKNITQDQIEWLNKNIKRHD